MQKVKFWGICRVLLGLTLVMLFLSCMTTEEREKKKQWELEGRNLKTGLFDEPYSGRSFQEKGDLEEFKATDEYQRAYENHQRFLVAFNENQRKVDEQNRLIDAENAAIDRRNAEIDRTRQANEANVRDSVQRHYTNMLQRQANGRLPLSTGSRYTNNGRGYVYDFILYNTEGGKEVIVHRETVNFTPPPLPAKESRKSRMSNTMRYNPNVSY